MLAGELVDQKDPDAPSKEERKLSQTFDRTRTGSVVHLKIGRGTEEGRAMEELATLALLPAPSPQKEWTMAK